MSSHLICIFEKDQYEAESFMASVRQLIDIHPEYNNFYIEIDHPPVSQDPTDGCFDYIALYGDKNDNK